MQNDKADCRHWLLEGRKGDEIDCVHWLYIETEPLKEVGSVLGVGGLEPQLVQVGQA